MKRWLAAAGIAAGCVGFGASPALAAGHATVGSLRPVGTVSLRSLPAKPMSPHALGSGGLGARVRLADPLDRLEADATASAAGFPTPSPLSVVNTPDRQGWEGITNLEQELAPGNGSFAVEPPDQGLCAGSYKGQTLLFESVNLALQVYDSHGNQLLPGAVALNQFFGLAPEIDQQGHFGPFVSDPKCYFDPQTHRWFHTALESNFDPKTGALLPPASTLLAVSATRDPLGAYHLYRIPATEFGQPNCPCFGDQPLIGADQYGVYINTSEYSMKQSRSNFAQLYAMPKLALEAGKPLRFVHFRNLTTTALDGRTTATIQPAFTDAPGENELANNGTEYLLSGFDCVPVSCDLTKGAFNKITFWALANTRSLETGHPALRLSRQLLTVGRYVNPPWQFQKPGPTPFGCNPKLGADCHTPPVEANDVRMNQVVYSHGLLWSGINTGVGPGKRVGIEYFIVKPAAGANGHTGARVARFAYVSAARENVSFPSVGVNAAGRGVIAFSLMGRAYYPSAAYVSVGVHGARGPIHVVASGFRPEDGFTCYKKPFGFGPPCRWGDYSASVAGPDGTIWSGTEWIGPHARDPYANWSTFIFPIKP
jgi:hypothetical protein